MQRDSHHGLLVQGVTREPTGSNIRPTVARVWGHAGVLHTSQPRTHLVVIDQLVALARPDCSWICNDELNGGAVVGEGKIGVEMVSGIPGGFTVVMTEMPVPVPFGFI